MPFFKKTKSYLIISLLDKIKIKKDYTKIFSLIIEYNKFMLNNKIQIKYKLSSDKKIKLFIKLFEERFYLEQIVRDKNIKSNSCINYTINNNIIYANIIYTSKIQIDVEYTLNSQDYSIYITINEKSFNVIEKNLKNINLYNYFNIILNFLYDDITIILTNIFTDYLKRGV